MVGFSWSSTVTSCVAVAVLPAASVAVQVTVVAPLAKLAGASLLAVTPGQLSDAVGLPSATPVAAQAPASVPTVRARGAVIVGFSSSVTVTVWTQVADLFPDASIACQVIVVTPFGYAAVRANPSLRVPETDPPGQLSPIVAVPTAAVVEQLPVPSSLVWAVTSTGQVT